MAACEYEMLRQQKIADNRKRMESLGLQQVLAVANAGSQNHSIRPEPMSRCTYAGIYSELHSTLTPISSP